MSAFYLLGLFAIWAILTGLVWKLWRSSRKEVGTKRILVDMAFAFAAFAWLTISFWYGGGRKYYYDAEVERLCAIDGGIKVYEAVTLSAVEYDGYAKRNWVLPRKEDAKPTDPYYDVSDTHFYREGNPQIARQQHSVIRRSDGKILGEMIIYGRGGGDLPGPWHGSSIHCPDLTKLPGFETSIFVKEIVK